MDLATFQPKSVSALVIIVLVLLLVLDKRLELRLRGRGRGRIIPRVLTTWMTIFALHLSPCFGQSTSAPPVQDPLMTLMLSQPKIDVESPVAASAVFDPPSVRPGDAVIYRVTFSALEESVELPAELPFPPELKVRAGGHGQMLSMTGPTLQPRTCFNYHLRPTAAGSITVPEFIATIYGRPVTVPAAKLEVVTALSPTNAPAQVLSLELPQTNLFVGQSLPVEILFPGLVGIALQGQAPVQLIGQGFLADQTSFRPRFEARPGAFGGRPVQTFIYEGSLAPVTAGKISLFAQSFVATRASGPGPVASPGPVAVTPNYTLLDSDPVELQVRPLPLAGRLPGFSGAVGEFSVATPELSTNVVRVGDPVKLTVKVRGDGNLLRLVPPRPPRLRYWEAFATAGESVAPQIIQAQGFTTFSYTLIPLSDKARFTPAIPFSCFDPQREVYRDLTIRSVPITVKPGTVPADLAALVLANALSLETEKEPTLSGLAAAPGLGAASLVPVQQQTWFPLVQLAPALAFAGLWGWDRRRRYLQEHPDVVLRRRARRALRRERRRIDQALQSGNAPAFASAAVSALRIACAPHLPAEPRALVGGDVLSVLSRTEQHSRPGEVVKRLFAVSDAAQFDLNPENGTEVLKLNPEFQAILRQLEERL